MVSAPNKIGTTFVIGLIVVSLVTLSMFGLGGNLRTPSMGNLGQLVAMWLAIIQKQGNHRLDGLPMYGYRNGLDFFTVYTPDTWGTPHGVFIDSSRFAQDRRIYIKVCYEPTVVQNTKIAATNALHLNADGSGVDWSALGSANALEYFMRFPCRYLGEMLTDPEMLSMWVSMVAGATWIKNLDGLLDWAGMNPDGTPYDNGTRPQGTASAYQNMPAYTPKYLLGTYDGVNVYASNADVAGLPTFAEARRTFIIQLLTGVVVLVALMFLLTRAGALMRPA